MAAEHNLYFGSFCPENTISCGAVGRHRQYVGPLENAFLSSSTYDSGPRKATRASYASLMPGDSLGSVRPSSLQLSPDDGLPQ
jgi:hypothetical protein